MLNLARYVGCILLSLLPCFIYSQLFTINTENLPDSLVVHHNYKTVRFILTNITSTPFKIITTKVKVPTDFPSHGWNNNCNGVTVAPGHNCTIISPIDYMPMTTGTIHWQFTINNGIDNYQKTIARPVVSPEQGLLETLTQGLPTYSVAGKKYPLVFTFTNTGRTAVSGITVDFPHITGLKLTNNCSSTLAAGTSCNVEGEYTAPNLPWQPISLTVTFHQGGNAYPLTVHTTISEIAIEGKFQAALPKNIPPGGNEVLILKYTNKSNRAATGVYVRLPATPGLAIQTNKCGNAKEPITLAPGATCVIAGIYTAPNNATGLQRLTFTLFSEQGANVPLTTITTVADAAINGGVQAPLPKNVSPGISYIFILNYKNTADKKATGVYVSLPKALGLSLNNNDCGNSEQPITLAPHHRLYLKQSQVSYRYSAI